MTDPDFLAISKRLVDAERELQQARSVVARMRQQLRSIGNLSGDLRCHSSLGLCVPGSGRRSGLDQVNAWPTHDEILKALQRQDELQQRVDDLREVVDNAINST